MGGPKVRICEACVGVCNTLLDVVSRGFAGWDAMGDDQLLSTLQPCSASIDATRAVLQTQVDVLRPRA